MVSYDGIVYASLETRIDLGTATIEVATRAGNLLGAQILYEHCSSHDKNHCKGTMPFACAVYAHLSDI